MSLMVRLATVDDVAAICAFGAEVVPAHYAPLIGAEAAQRQVRSWWTPGVIGDAVAQQYAVLMLDGDDIVGVGERGRFGVDHVIWKLYVHPERRGEGIGPRLIAALVDQLPADATRVYVEHFRANERAAAFYEREGFTLERTDPHPSGDPLLDSVWLVHRLVG